MFKALAILNILGIFALGSHDLLSHYAFSQESTAIGSSCCTSCEGCDADQASGEDEDASSCSTMCDCGCFQLSAVSALPMEIPLNRELQEYFPDRDHSYDFEFKAPLFEPPRLA